MQPGHVIPAAITNRASSLWPQTVSAQPLPVLDRLTKVDLTGLASVVHRNRQLSPPLVLICFFGPTADHGDTPQGSPPRAATDHASPSRPRDLSDKSASLLGNVRGRLASGRLEALDQHVFRDSDRPSAVELRDLAADLISRMDQIEG